MGLLELLQQGQTLLSAGSFPNDAPINDPQSGFIHSNLPTNTYEDETLGQPNNGSTLINTLDNTALDITNFNQSNNIDSPIYDWVTNYPSLVSGDFNGTPSQYEPLYNADNTYLSNIPIETPNSPQVNTLNQTGLDNTNSNAEQTATIPNNISAPNDYPELVSGKFGGSPLPYGALYNANNTYLSNIPVQDPNSTQINTLFSTGLDNTNTNFDPTTVVPDSISYPNNYPALTSGEFNGASSQYTSPYNSENPYLNSIPIQDPNSPQIPTLGETGLDLDNSEYSPTAIQPSSIAYPNNYPAIEGVNLGGFGGPEQYDTGSNLDNTGTGISTLSHVTPPLSIYRPNNYPTIPHVYLGEFNSGPSQYITPYNPASSYLEQYDELKNETTNPQINTLDETGLDVENPDALLTSLLFAPTNPDNITTYPVITGINLGVTGSGAQGFNQVYKPSNTYWNNYLTNRSLFDALTV